MGITTGLQQRLTECTLALHDCAAALIDPAAQVIDLDAAAQLCRQAASALDQALQAETGRQLLRRELELRLAGMLKGIAVAARSKDALHSAETELAQLSLITDEELLTRLERVSARFRDCFPGVMLPRYEATRSGRPVR